MRVIWTTGTGSVVAVRSLTTGAGMFSTVWLMSEVMAIKVDLGLHSVSLPHIFLPLLYFLSLPYLGSYFPTTGPFSSVPLMNVLFLNGNLSLGGLFLASASLVGLGLVVF